MKYANEILLMYTFLTTTVTLIVSQKPNSGMHVPNDQNAFFTPKPISERKNLNETDSSPRDLESMAARVAEFTDRSHKYSDDTSLKNLKEKKVKYVQPVLKTDDNNNSSSSALIRKLNTENEPKSILHNKKAFSERENQFKNTEDEDESDSLETSPSEHVRTSDRTRKWEHRSPPRNVQDIKAMKDSDAQPHQVLTPSNQTNEETRLLGIWKLPPEFIGFQISDGESSNMAKPAAVVESRSFITNPDISSVQLNFVVPQGKVVQEESKNSSVVKNKQRRQHNNDESYSSAEHSGEGRPSDVYTEADGDLGKLLDEDYKARIEKEAEAFIKKNKQENKGGEDSSEDDKQQPRSHKHHKPAYSNNHTPSPQRDNIYHGNSIPPKPYSQQEYSHHDRNKTPQIQSQSGYVHNKANNLPQTFSRQKMTFPGRTVFFYKGMDGMLYDPALFPGLFESTKDQNSPKLNEGYIQNSPPSSEIYISPNYKTHPLYLEDGYPLEYSNPTHNPSSNYEQPKLLLVQPIEESPAINEKRPRNLQPFVVPGNHQYAQPHSSENLRQPPPVYKKHYREALKVSDEQYQEPPPTNYEHRERDLPVHNVYKKYQNNENGYHSTIPYQQRQPNFMEQEQHQFNSDSSEEDCSPEEKDLDQTSDLDEDHLPVAPVPQANLNINNPIPVNSPHRPHENDNLQPFNGNPENQNRYLSHVSQRPHEKDNLQPFNGNPENQNRYLPHVPHRPHENDNLQPFNGNPENQNRYLPHVPHRPHEKDNLQPFNGNPENQKRYLPHVPHRPHENDNLQPFDGNPENQNRYLSHVHHRPHENDNLQPFNSNPENQNRYLSQEPINEQKIINSPAITSSPPYSPQGLNSEEHINSPAIPSNHPDYSREQYTEPVEPYNDEKENPETFQYERKHKYQVSMYEHDESIYQSKAPKVSPYEPVLKTSSEEFVPGHPLHSAEEPNIIPQDENPNLISPQDQTRHIQFEDGFRPMSAPAVYGSKPDCHRAIDSHISHSDPHINSIPSPHHRDLEHSPPSETYQDSPQDGTNINDMETQNQKGKYLEPEGSADEDFHPHASPQENHNPHQQYQDESSEMPRSTEQISPQPTSYSNSNEDKEAEHRHQPKLRVVTAPIPHKKQNKYPNADQYGEEHFKKDLSLRPEVSSRYHESSEPQNEASIEKKKSKKRSSKSSKVRRNKRNGKKANKNVKKSRKHRSTRENMMAEAATYHWGMENHKDKDGFFLYANVPHDDAYEYGYRMGGPDQLVEKHHRTEGDTSKIKLNWEDKNGDSGDQYWEFNHSSSEGEDEEKPKKRTQKSTTT